MDQPTNEQLITQYLSGDQMALEILISKNLKLIYNFHLRQTNDPTIAEDLTQETFIKVWKNLKKFKVDKNFQVWLFTIAKNTLFDYFKKKKILVFSDWEDDDGNNQLADQLTDPAPLPEEIFFSKNLTAQLQQALTTLTASQRLAINLHHYDELTFAEISEVARVSENTAKSWYRRGLQKLRENLDPNQFK